MSELLGEYRHKLDAKGRLSLPADFRRSLPKDLKVVPDPESQCLYVFDSDSYSRWVEGLFESSGGFAVSSKKMAALRKVLNSRVRNCEIDNSGRIHLNPGQREIAGLEKDVVLIGDEDHFEVWDTDRWDEFCSSVDLSELLQ